ncbi:MAG: SDR family oxidoreductase [Actinomycetota bacterium]
MSDAPGLAVVTGASSGIGRAFAESLAAQGHAVLLVARREDRLRELAERLAEAYAVPASVCVADLATPQGRERCRAAVDATPRPPEVAVLNAGFGTRGPLAGLDREREGEEVALNCLGVVDLGVHVLPGMVERGRGTIVVVSSASGYLPVPYMSTYAATKAFGLRWAEGLAYELRGTGVRAIAVCPGPTRTEFTTGVPEGRLYEALRRDTPQDVVEATWRALARGRSRVPTGAIARLTAAATRVVPRRLVVAAAGAIHRPRQGPGPSR